MAKTKKDPPAPKKAKAAKAEDGVLDPAPKTDNKIAREQRLPGMTDAAIEEIETAAYDYIEARDARMELGRKEKEKKEMLLALMHKHERKEYRHGRLSIAIVPEGEKLKVGLDDNALEPGESEEIVLSGANHVAAVNGSGSLGADKHAH